MMRKLQIALATALTFGISQVATTAYADNIISICRRCYLTNAECQCCR